MYTFSIVTTEKKKSPRDRRVCVHSKCFDDNSVVCIRVYVCTYRQGININRTHMHVKKEGTLIYTYIYTSEGIDKQQKRERERKGGKNLQRNTSMSIYQYNCAFILAFCSFVFFLFLFDFFVAIFFSS